MVEALRTSLAGNRISSLMGILNGTSNYILSEMTSNGLDFDVALKQAQQLGYAEADPTLDIDGHDAAHKLTLLIRLAYGVNYPYTAMPVRGIRGMSSLDIALAREFGYRIKLIAQVRERREPGQPDDKVRLEAGVFPALVPYTVLLARVGGVYKNKKIAVYRGTDCIYSRKRPVLAPGEMETVRLKAELLRGPGDAVTVTLEEG